MLDKGNTSKRDMEQSEGDQKILKSLRSYSTITTRLNKNGLHGSVSRPKPQLSKKKEYKSLSHLYQKTS